MKYTMGQALWRASYQTRQTSVECPDCGGTGRLRVTFHDETTVSVECAGCQRGCDPPTGRITVYDRTAYAEPGIVSGIEIKPDGSVEYRLNVTLYTYHVDERDLFESREEALARAAEIAAKADADERAKVAEKEKPTRTWAWNAHYHRREIKRAEQSIAYHRAKLEAANLKAKQPARHLTARGTQRNEMDYWDRDTFLSDVQNIPQIKRGVVWCRHCGRTAKCNAENMLTGWPKCCGYTMTLDSPAERS